MVLDIDVLVLAAGFGTRLKPVTDSCPKALVTVGGKTLLERHLEMLASFGIKRVIINLHHLPDQIREFVKDGDSWGLEVVYSYEPEILDTGGAIKNIAALRKHDLLLTINADALFLDLVPIDRLVRQHREDLDEPIATMLLREDSAAKSFGAIGVDSAGRVVDFLGRSSGGVVEKNLMFPGIQLLTQDLVALMPSERKVFSVTRDVLAPAVENGACIKSYLYTGRWFDVGTPERLKVADEECS